MPEPVERTQADGYAADEAYGDMTAIDCSKDPQITRQEEAASTDLNKILQKFSVTGIMPPIRQPNYTEVDYETDLQGAFRAIQDAKDIYNSLPDGVKAKYANWTEVLKAAESGQLKEDMVDPNAQPKEEVTPEPAPEPQPPA